MYLRPPELTLLRLIGMTFSELNGFSILWCHAISYVPSGWLADRFSPSVYLFLGMTGVIGLWYATLPAASWITLIFGLLGNYHGTYVLQRY